MSEYLGWVVRSEAGHDRGDLFCVVGSDRGLLLLADGKRRKLSAPKRKKLGHVTVVSRGQFDHPVLRELQQGAPVSDRALRRALAAIKEGITLG